MLATRTKRWVLLGIVSIGLLLITMDNTILYTALPELTEVLGATASEKLWIINAYPLVMAGLLLGAGTLGDRVGHRRMFLSGLVIFGLASILAAFSPTPLALIAARALLAVGAAAIMPATLALIRITFTDAKELGVALALWGSVSVVGSAAGPLLGGMLLEFFWWGSVFLINVPIVIVAFFSTLALADDDAGTSRQPWDLVSSLYALVGLGGVVYFIKDVIQPDAQLLTAALSLVIGVGALLLFVRRQRRLENPLLDFGIFRIPAVLTGVVSAAAAMFAIGGTQLASTQRFQLVLEWTPLEAGLIVMVVALGCFPGAMISGVIVHRVGLRPLVVSGFAIGTAGVATMVAGLTAGLWVLGAGMFVLGVGLGTVMGVASLAIVGYVPRRRAGMASSVEEVSYEAGSLLAVAILGAVLNAVYAATIQLPVGAPAEAGTSIDAARAVGGDSVMSAAAAAFDNGYLTVLLITMAVLAAATAFAFLALRRHVDAVDATH